MCANYETITSAERMVRFTRLGLPLGTWPGESYPLYQAPFVRRDRETGDREPALGLFGLVPHWSKDMTIGRRTYNARSETAAEKPAFRDAWKFGRRCVIPLESFYEPNWESGKAIRWRIGAADGEPMGIAGLWSFWRSPEGPEVLSMTMLTVNADGHEVMQHFHKPGDEKRMIVILDESQYDAWLDAPVPDMMAFMQRWPAERLVAEPAPKPKPAPKAA